jgi:hypothetical protein
MDALDEDSPDDDKGTPSEESLYYVNPHMSNSNKISTTKQNHFLYNYLAQSNKYPKTKIE